jgi:zinc transport system substrate-binding protein
MAEALIEADPEGRDVYSRGLGELQRELTGLQEELSGILEDARGSAFVVFHPSWGYFADEFGLVQLPIEVEGQEPSPGELAELVDEARRLEVPVVLVAPQFSRRTAETVAGEIGATVEVADPLARDWPDNLVSVASSIAGAE